MSRLMEDRLLLHLAVMIGRLCGPGGDTEGQADSSRTCALHVSPIRLAGAFPALI